MKTISDYLKEYGKYTLLEKEFNEVDNVILSMLAYVDFEGIVPAIDYGSITLKEASELFYKKYTKKEINKCLFSIRDTSLLLKDIANTKRFKDLELLNYERQVTFDTQFGAMCIKLPDKKMYVAFEGTDNYLSSWKEDFMITYQFPVKAQKIAIEYLNMVVGIFGPKIYVGGHSKGGNLALVASMYCHNYVYRKIKQVYNNDGPGLMENEFASNRYKRVSYRYTHIVPNESVFGILLNHPENTIVVKSGKKNFFQHNSFNWVVEDDHFKRSSSSKFSLKIHSAFDNWLKNSDLKSREEAIDILFNVFSKAGVTDLKEVKQNVLSNIIKIIRETKNVSKENKVFLTNVLNDMKDGWRNN